MKHFTKKYFLMMVFLVAAMTFAMAVGTAAQDVIIVIDPGHGGTEGGAARAGYKEEVINQKIANYLKEELLTYEGIQVYMTRTSVAQKAQNREERVAIAKKKNATALISIHINSTGADSQTAITGAMAAAPSKAYSSASAIEARALATSILKGLASRTGVKNNGFWYDDELGIILFAQKKNYTTAEAKSLGSSRTVLNRQIPSMIIEHAFINNPNDRSRYLKTDAALKKLALGDADGIVKYYKLQKKRASTVDPGDEEYEEEEEEIQTGLVKIDGLWYLFDEEGNPMEGLVKYEGKFYYAYADGELASGWMWIGNRHYFFGIKTSAGLNGVYKIGKHKYYFKNGYARTKWHNINGLRYYFSKTDGHLLCNYWLNWNGHWYYLNSNGTPWKSCSKIINGVVYRFNSRGYCLNRWQ